MVRSIILVAALLAGFCYCAAFLMWNAELKTEVIVWNLGGSPQWLPDIPIAFLPIVGTMVGALIMAIAAWAPWASQRAAAKAARTKMTKALQRFDEQKERIEAQRAEIEELKERLEEAESAVETVAAPAESETAEEDVAEDVELPDADELTL